MSRAPEPDELCEERVAFLGLAAQRGIGYWTLRKLYSKRGSFADVLNLPSVEAFRALAKDAGAKLGKLPTDDWSDFCRRVIANGEDQLGELRAMRVRLLLEKDHDFPEQLTGAVDAPRWLFVQGEPASLYESSIAMVGTRTPTADGLWLTDFACACLHDMNTVTVSGLAEGIDTRVHERSVRFGIPTIAVLGTGIRHDFPKGSTELRREIVRSGGAIVTEYLPDDTYSKETFVRRNRIQAALASVVVPLEWREKSGTTHTVRYAHAAHRPILCVRMPDWTEAAHAELGLARRLLGAHVFTIPGEEEAFRAKLAEGLRGELLDRAPSSDKAPEPIARSEQQFLFGADDDNKRGRA